MGESISRMIRLVAVAVMALASPMPALAKKPAKKVATTFGSAQDLRKAGLENLQHREYAAAISNFSRAARAEGSSAGYFLLGYAHYQRGFMGGSPDSADKQDAVEVVNAYTTAQALDPALSELEQPYKLYHGLAMAYEALGSNDKALDSYKKAMNLAPSNPMLPLYASRLRWRMGEAVPSLNNLEMSLKRARLLAQEGALITAIRTNPMFAELASSRDHLRVIRQYDPIAASSMAEPTQTAAVPRPARRAPATEELRDSVKDTAAAPRQERSRQDQAVLDAIASANDEFKFRRYPKAIELYNDALILNEQSGSLSPGQAAFVQERIGTSYNKLGQTTQAITALRRSVQAMPYNSSAHYQLALAYSVSGHFNDAVKALRESFKTASSKPELKKLMLLAKIDPELDPLRDLPSYHTALGDYFERAHAQSR